MGAANEGAELVDVYDGNRRFTGEVIPRAEAHLPKGRFMLYALAIVEDAAGAYLITQRALDKHWAAGWWEVPGGGVLSGETTAQAIAREVREETGLSVPREAAPVYSYMNEDPCGDNYFADVFHFRLGFTASDVTLQKSEAVDFKLATWEDVKAIAGRGEFLHFERIRRALEAEGAL